jgi:hypothetical protein
MAWSQLGQLKNTSVTLNTNIFTTGLKGVRPPSAIVIFATFAVAGTLTIKKTLADGATVISKVLNAGNNLTANNEFEFDESLDSGESLNFQFSATTTCIELVIYEDVGEPGA